jgi:hypothetical protein
MGPFGIGIAGLLAFLGLFNLAGPFAWTGVSVAGNSVEIRGLHVMAPLASTQNDNVVVDSVGVGPRMVYGGGPIQHSPKVYITYWQWHSDPAGERARLESFFNGVGGSGWINSQTQYCQNLSMTAIDCSGAASADIITNPTGQLAGEWTDTVNPIPVPLDETNALAGEAARSLFHFGYSPDAQYVIATPHRISTPGFVANGGGYCAWHAAVIVNSMVASFTNLPYMTDGGANCGAGFVNAGPAGALDGVSIVAGHEYAESMTDPVTTAGTLPLTESGWSDPLPNNSETGDKCAWIKTGPGASGNVTLSTGIFPVQSLWSNNANQGLGGCVISYSDVGHQS